MGSRGYSPCAMLITQALRVRPKHRRSAAHIADESRRELTHVECEPRLAMPRDVALIGTASQRQLDEMQRHQALFGAELVEIAGQVDDLARPTARIGSKHVAIDDLARPRDRRHRQFIRNVRFGRQHPNLVPPCDLTADDAKQFAEFDALRRLDPPRLAQGGPARAAAQRFDLADALEAALPDQPQSYRNAARHAFDLDDDGRHQRIGKHRFVGRRKPQRAKLRAALCREQRAQRRPVAVVEPLRSGDEAQCVARTHQLDGAQHEVCVQAGQLRGADAACGHAVAIPLLPLRFDIVMAHVRRVAEEQHPPVRLERRRAKVGLDDVDALLHATVANSLSQQLDHPRIVFHRDDPRRGKAPRGSDREASAARTSIDDGVERAASLDEVEHPIDQPRRRQRDAARAALLDRHRRAVAFVGRVDVLRRREQRRLAAPELSYVHPASCSRNAAMGTMCRDPSALRVMITASKFTAPPACACRPSRSCPRVCRRAGSRCPGPQRDARHSPI